MNSILRNIFEALFARWFVPARHRSMRGRKRLASFVTVHDVPELEHARVATPTFAVVLARSSDGIVLVFNRYRELWELPGGFMDAGESPRDAAARELKEEAGCTARSLCWLGLVEVDDGSPHFGGVFACEVDDVPPVFQNDEIAALGRWQCRQHPRPLGESDAALLNRFG